MDRTDASAPKWPISKLLRLCTNRIARNIAASVEKDIASYYHNRASTFDDLISMAREHGTSCGFDTLPVELVKLVFQDLKFISPDALLLLGAAFGSLVDSLSFAFDRVPARSFFLPWCESVSAGLKSIDLLHMSVTEDALLALAHSQIAPALTALSLNTLLLSDRSISLWSCFSSLKTLNCSDSSPFSEAHLTALSQMSTLETLTVTPDFAWIEAARILLAPEALPSLQTLRIVCDSDVSDSAKALHAILLARPAKVRNRLGRLPLLWIHLEYPLLAELVSRIQKLCPELDLAPEELRHSPELGAQIAQQQVPAELLHDATFFAVDYHLDDADDDSLVRDNASFRTVLSCANQTLELVHIDGVELNDESWFALSQLNSLSTLNCLNPGIAPSHFFSDIAPRVLPSTLRSLFLRFSHTEEDTVSSDALDVFIRFLCTNLRDLTTLTLDIANQGLTPDHIASIMRNLLHLTYFGGTLAAQTQTGDPISLPLSHPSLTRWPRIVQKDSELCRLQPVALPSLKQLAPVALATTDLLPVCDLTPAIAPHLESVELDLSSNTVTQIDTLVAAVAKFEHSLRRLTLQFPEQCEQRSGDLSALSCLHQLRNLELINARLSDAQCSTFLANYPMLNRLALLGCSGLNSFAWMRHNVLSEVRLSLTTIGNGSAEVRLDDPILPNLGSLHLTLPELQRGSIWLSGLKQLLEVQITMPGKDRGPVYIADCAALERITLLNINFEALALTKCPRLASLTLTRCQNFESALEEGKVYMHENNATFRRTVIGKRLADGWHTQGNQENLQRIEALFASDNF